MRMKKTKIAFEVLCTLALFFTDIAHADPHRINMNPSADAKEYLHNTELKVKNSNASPVRELRVANRVEFSHDSDEISPIGVDEFGNSLSAITSREQSIRSASSEIPAYWPNRRGEIKLRSIIGSDGRYRITNTTTHPNSAVVYITRYGHPHCSGWMISKDTLVTAGHCLYDHGKQRWYAGLSFAPGSNGRLRPFGFDSAKQMWTDTSYARYGNPRQDWGIVKLNRSIGNSTGWFGMQWTSGSYNKTWVAVRGYPGDKPAGQMWSMSGSVSLSKSNQLCYFVDTIGGQSESPVFLPRNGQVIAIHTYGLGYGKNRQCPSNYNAGTRITKGLYELILRLK